MIGLVELAGLLWGAFWALVRDQDGPYFHGKPKGAPDNKWKEVGLVAFGAPLGAAAALLWGGAWWQDIAVGLLVTVAVGGAWSQGHPEGYATLERGAMLPMALSGALLGIGPTLWLLAQSAWFLAPLPLLAGAGKLPCYMLGRKVRGPDPHPWPHATAIGAVLHGATFMGVTLLAMWLKA